MADSDWALMKPDLFAVIQDFFSSNLPVVKEEDDDGSILSSGEQGAADKIDFEYVWFQSEEF